PPADAEVEGWLQTLGVTSLCEWDVLVFLHRHQATLVGADHLARLLGHADEPVVAALEALDSLGLLARSRVSQGARLYQFTAPAGPPRGEAFQRLSAMADDRDGRLRLAKLLPRSNQSPQAGPEATRRFRRGVQPVVRAKPQQTRDLDEGRKTWRTAI